MQHTRKDIFIVLGTYNGARFLHEQLSSIQAQTLQNWRLLVRDDGSSDDTLYVVREFSATDERIECLEDGKGRLGIKDNFGELMCVALERGAEMLCFADQDDVWLPHKLAEYVAELERCELRNDPTIPILIHSDLTVVDGELTMIHKSFARYQGLAHMAHRPIEALIAQNFVTGSAMVINRPLLKLAVPLPAAAMLHDWWVALCAAACGRLEYIDTSALLYRQHDNNEIGARSKWGRLNPFAPYFGKLLRRNRVVFKGTFIQAAALQDRIRTRCVEVPDEVLHLLGTYASLLSMTRLRRVDTVIKLGIRRQGLWPQLIFFFWLLYESRKSQAKEAINLS